MVKLGGVAVVICCAEMLHEANVPQDQRRINIEVVEDGSIMLVDGIEADRCPYCGTPFRCGD